MMLNWHIVTREQYNAGTPVASSLYFIKGENVIYRGTDLYTQAIQFYTGEEKPANPAPGRIYFNTATSTGSVYENNGWVDVIKPAEAAAEIVVDGTVTADGANAVSGKAVNDFVAAEIAKVLTNATWDPTEHMLTFPKGFVEGEDAPEVNIVLTGLGVGLQYNKTTGKLDLLDASGNAIGDGINLDLDRFVTSGEYDAVNKKIILFFDAEKTDKVEIPVAEIMALSAVEGNALTMKDDGLYVATPDLSGYLAKPESTTEGNVVVFDAEGNVVDSGKSLDEFVAEVTAGHAVYRGATLDEALTGHTPAQNDIAIITTTTPATEEGGDATTTVTTYSYDGTKWVVIATTASAGQVAPAPSVEIATTENAATSAAEASDSKAASEKLVLTKYEELASALEWKETM